MEEYLWHNPEFRDSYSKNYNKLSKGLEGLIDKEMKKKESEVKRVETDESIVYDEKSLSIYYKDGLEVALPFEYLNLTYPQFDKIIQSIILNLTPEEKNRLVEEWARYDTGFKREELEEALNKFIQGKTEYGINIKQFFFNGFKRGLYDKSYVKEEEINDKINKKLYDIKMIKNAKKAIKNRKILKEKGEVHKIIEEQRKTGLIGITKRDAVYFELSDCESYDSTFEQNKDIPVKTIIKIEPQSQVSQTHSISSKRIKKVKKKNQINIVISSQEEINEFRRQERERYNNPLQPYYYKLKNGEKRIVAPASKKASDGTAKAREHYLLKGDRPAIVTLLSLVRDAACKLPKGFGTRMDICELLKESQFINEDVNEDKMSNVVSGALDRLHYEKDPCVKYDSDKKLWFYLHINRQPNDFLDDKGKSVSFLKKMQGEHGEKIN